jgi:hypothetical protein
MGSMDQYLMEDRLWMVSRPAHSPTYDFDFRQFFRCHSPYGAPSNLAGVARIGAISDYPALYADLLKNGIRLINSVEQHERAASLPE